MITLWIIIVVLIAISCFMTFNNLETNRPLTQALIPLIFALGIGLGIAEIKYAGLFHMVHNTTTHQD